MPVVNTGRFDINYIEEGEGFPVLLIHGLAGDHGLAAATCRLERQVPGDRVRQPRLG